ncbi:hypothetical protein [Paraburkholderia sp. GAS334]|uniref:hypothetical protein n=1 Tax=Paraburkholderia sp. GAS334 TaxID=3035131 RepID=UPI003D1E1C6C
MAHAMRQVRIGKIIASEGDQVGVAILDRGCGHSAARPPNAMIGSQNTLPSVRDATGVQTRALDDESGDIRAECCNHARCAFC